MRKLLAGVVLVCAALVTAACNASAEPMLELAGDPPVSVRSAKVLVGTLSHAEALAGLKQALPHLQQAAKQSEAEGKRTGGSFVANFVIEPDGMIRIMTEDDVRLPAEVVEGLVGSTMNNKWRFPASGGQSIIETEFVVGPAVADLQVDRRGKANMEQPNPFLQFLPLLMSSLTFGFVIRRLAKDKGRNVRKWTIWGFIPFVNLLLVPYFMGAANLRAERKLDALLQAQGKDPASFK